MNKIFLSILLIFSFSTGAFADENTVQLKLVAADGKFEPTELKAPTGKRIELLVENKGPGAEEFESKELKREKVIPQGQTVKINLGPLKKGTYQFFGEYHAETALGKLIIE